MRTSAPSLIALCLTVLGACSNGATESYPSQAQSSATDASSSEAAERPGEYIPALIATWDYEYRGAERRAILRNFTGLVKDADRVVARLSFVDEETWWLGFLFDGELFLLDGEPEGDNGTYKVKGDQLATTGAHEEVLVTYTWTLKGNKLSLVAAEECKVVGGAKVGCIRDRESMDPMMRLVTEHTFTRSGNDVTY